MNDTQIALLIKARNKITDVMVHDDIATDTAAIDALLSEVPAGYDNTVDLLLGRMCAKLPERKYTQSPAVTLITASPLGTAKAAQFAAHVAGLSAADIAEMCLRCDETATESPSHDGMWK